MIAPLSVAAGVTYKRVAKPVLFHHAPDIVHERMLRVATHLQHHPNLLAMLRTSWSYQNAPLLGQTLHGIYFANPVGLSAGFDKNVELSPLVHAIGFGFMEGGSVTRYPCAGNPRPWFYRLPKSRSLVVHAGLGNYGANKIAKKIDDYPRELFDYFPLNISIAKTNSPSVVDRKEGIDDYAYSFQKFAKKKEVRMITLNISCPNAYGGEPFTDPKSLNALLNRLDRKPAPDKAVFIKMPSDLSWPQFKALLAVADRHNIQGITIGNLTKDRQHARLRDPLPDNVQGGLSGKPTWERTNNLIKQTYRQYGKRFTIIGVGGIFSAEDAYTKITLGASLVELITGMVFEGPQLIGQVNKGLVALLAHDGYANIGEAVGSRA